MLLYDIFKITSRFTYMIIKHAILLQNTLLLLISFHFRDINMSDEEKTSSQDEMLILLATDIHLGVYENDPVRSKEK